jgi:hypothetical protein
MARAQTQVLLLLDCIRLHNSSNIDLVYKDFAPIRLEAPKEVIKPVASKSKKKRNLLNGEAYPTNIQKPQVHLPTVYTQDDLVAQYFAQVKEYLQHIIMWNDLCEETRMSDVWKEFADDLLLTL